MNSSQTDSFKQISPAEFFYRNRQMAGFSNPTQALFTTVRELVENSLDACEDARVIPDIHVEISCCETNIFRVSVTDNGTGVSPDQVPDAFARVLYGSKYSSRQRRGTFGMGVTMSVLYGQITTDSPALVHSRTTENDGLQFSLHIDVQENTPIVESMVSLPRDKQGTTVRITLQADLKRSRDRIIEYLRLSGLSTPYARISLQIDESKAYSFGGFTSKLPSIPIISKPHPRAADIELLRRLVSAAGPMQLDAFLIESFQNLGRATASKFLRFIHLDPKYNVQSLDRSDLNLLSSSLRNYPEFGRPSSDCLSPIGKNAFLKAVQSEYASSAASYSQKGPMEWEGFPYIIEAMLVLSDAFEKVDVPTLFRFANKVPLLYDNSDDVFSKVLKRVPWTRYGIHDTSQVAIFVNFCSTRVPYSAAGKQSISSVSSIESEILSIYRDLGRSLKKLSDRQRRTSQYKRRYNDFSKTFKLLTKFSSEIAEAEAVPEVDAMVDRLFEVNVDA